FTIHRLPTPTLFPYTTLFRSPARGRFGGHGADVGRPGGGSACRLSDTFSEKTAASDFETCAFYRRYDRASGRRADCHHRAGVARSEEHTSELQSRENIVCRLL